MMKQKKSIFLFLALGFPILIFVFLRFFGKNEFTVKPLFTEMNSEILEGCFAVSFPYHVSDSVMRQLNLRGDSLVLVLFGEPTEEGKIQVNRVMDEVAKNEIRMIRYPVLGTKVSQWKSCVFLLKDPFDLVLVDKHGQIRGQYTSSDREEIDRLLMELTIILKKY